jgi:hypothetical protein
MEYKNYSEEEEEIESSEDEKSYEGYKQPITGMTGMTGMSDPNKSDCSDGSDDEDEIQNSMFKSKKGNNKVDQAISTEGLAPYLYDDIMDKNLKMSLGKCIFCTKFYSEDMLIPADKNEERQCYHCLFWMNYAPESRKLVDGTCGLLIVDYVLKCKDIHLIDDCTRKSDSGGCILCEFNLGIPITDVKDGHKLSNNFADGMHGYTEDDDVDVHVNEEKEYVIDI